MFHLSLDQAMDFNIENYLPHRPPVILLDKILLLNHEMAISEVHISKKSEFFQEKGVPAWFGVEYMAQTVALYAGKIDYDTGGKAVIGFLLGARKYNSYVGYFREGQILRVEVMPLLIEEPISNFFCKIISGSDLVAESKITAYKPNKEMLAELKQ